MPGLPHPDRAFVEDAKITDYLLNHDHRDGGPKAAVFLGYGFHPARIDEFRDALLRAGKSGEARTVHGPSGLKYIVDGECRCPDGRTLYIRTVWHAVSADEPPRLVSAYPRKP